MKRQSLDNGNWFDVDAADKYAEESDWDGSSHISRATGSQWDHECLYKTASGRWVLNSWSQRQGTGEIWTEIDGETAARWLVRNGHDVETAETAALEI